MKATWIALAVVVGLAGTSVAEPKPRWSAYKSTLLNIQVSVPSDWKASKIPKALAFRYDDLAGGTAGVGILKSSQIGTAEEGADHELKTDGHPGDWAQSNATVAGQKAIKITGTDAKDNTKRFVHYFVQTPNGVYIIQCLGTADRWHTFGPVFATILSKLQFI